MLRWRLILGVVFISSLAGLCWLDHVCSPRGFVLGPVGIAVALVATSEVLHLVREAGARPAVGAVYTGVVLAAAAAVAAPFLVLLGGAGTILTSMPLGRITGGSFLGPALVLGVLICAVAVIRRFDGTKQCAVDFAASVFVVTYVGGAFAVLALLRLLDAEGDADRGLALLIATVVIVKAGDVGAYAIGRLFGRRKLAPRLSPGKTWEGALGAVGSSSVAGLVLLLILSRENAVAAGNVLQMASWLGFSVALSVAGIIGDLAESLLKRAASVKDSSTWMPGFGGVLDVVDSLLLAGPVAYVLAALRILEF